MTVWWFWSLRAILADAKDGNVNKLQISALDCVASKSSMATLTRVSPGVPINKAVDDAAGNQISGRFVKRVPAKESKNLRSTSPCM